MLLAYVWSHVPPSQLLEKIPYSAAVVSARSACVALKNVLVAFR